jgi:hypothetical protein
MGIATALVVRYAVARAVLAVQPASRITGPTKSSHPAGFFTQ